jgi:hypothetical protein
MSGSLPEERIMLTERYRWEHLRQRLRRLINRDGAAIAIIAITWAIFFSRLLNGSSVYFLDDLKIIFYPLEVIYAAFQQAWSLPVWAPEFGFGQPLLGWGQLGFFTPVHVVLRLLGVHPLNLLQISVVTYFAVGLVGMFVWLRSRRLSPPAAATGAIVFAFSGFAIGHLNHVNFYTSTMLLPWLLLMVDRFTHSPTSTHTALLSLVAATVALSGQPQVALYTLLIGALYGIIQWVAVVAKHWRTGRQATVRYLAWSVVYAVVAGILFGAVAAFAVLPLQEFLPYTERSDALFEGELFEFSYPPAHAITLVWPTFFGTKDTYWGAKNFQELAAYVGILPLLLAGVSLAWWREQRRERIFGVLLVLIAAWFALGQYSSLYRYLVEHKLLTSLSVPGRFVYFFNVGIALLAALGLDNLLRLPTWPRWQRLVALALSLFLMSLTVFPLMLALPDQPRAAEQLRFYLTHWHYELLVSLVGLLAFVIGLFSARWPKAHPTAQYALLGITAATLLIYGWNYNPLTDRATALTPSPFTSYLQQYRAETGLPPRLYVLDGPIVSRQSSAATRPTQPISATFSVFQPLTILHDNLTCVRVLLETDPAVRGVVDFGLHTSLKAQPFRRISFHANDVPTKGIHRICFPPVTNSSGKTVYASFTSPTASGIRLYFHPTTVVADKAYFLPTTERTDEVLRRSQRGARLELHQEFHYVSLDEAWILQRHLNVVAGASSARWIGALSIRPYREFIEGFFANDSDPIDGDEQLFIDRYRGLFDQSGVTHVIEVVPAGSPPVPAAAGYQFIASATFGDQEARLYYNAQAFPKAFLVRNAFFKAPADEIRFELYKPTYQPRETIYLSGNRIPPVLPQHGPGPVPGQATITRYSPARVEVEVTTAEDTVLVLNDAPTPQWRARLDGQATELFTANTTFRAVLVPSGTHQVVFQYDSPAIRTSKYSALAALIVVVIMLLTPRAQRLLSNWFRQ